MNITRRGLLGTLIGLPFGVKAAQAASLNKSQLDTQLIDDLTGVLLNKFFTHIVYSEFPRHIGPTVGNDMVFSQEVIQAWKLKWGLPTLHATYGDFWYQGANDCLAKAGIKAIYTMMVTARKHKDGVLFTYHVIQGNDLPSPTKDEISRAIVRMG